MEETHDTAPAIVAPQRDTASNMMATPQQYITRPFQQNQLSTPTMRCRMLPREPQLLL